MNFYYKNKTKKLISHLFTQDGDMMNANKLLNVQELKYLHPHLPHNLILEEMSLTF